MKFENETEKRKAEKKVQIAIDKMVDLQDAGHGCDAISRVLDYLNMLECEINEGEVRRQHN